jgi:hypothetical protein
MLHLEYEIQNSEAHVHLFHKLVLVILACRFYISELEHPGLTIEANINTNTYINIYYINICYIYKYKYILYINIIIYITRM